MSGPYGLTANILAPEVVARDMTRASARPIDVSIVEVGHRLLPRPSGRGSSPAAALHITEGPVD